MAIRALLLLFCMPLGYKGILKKFMSIVTLLFFVKVAQDGYVRTLVDTGRSWTPPFVDHATHVFLKREKSV